MFKKFLVLIIITLILTNGLNIVFAVDTYEGYNLPVDIDINGNFIKCEKKPIILDNTTYIPLRAFSDAIGGIIEWNENEMSATLTKDEHSFVFYPEGNHSLIDGVEKNFSAILYNDLTFVPIRAISEVLGYEVLWDDYYLIVKIIAPGVTVPENCIDHSYTYDDILYLAKITYIESGAEPFVVQLGIADTVVNRVKSPLFPNTIKDVILDTKYGIQFPPAHTDKINKIPSAESVIAAKCALGGITVVRNSLYFINAKSAPSSWVHNNRTFYTTLNNVSFYE